MIIIEEKRKYVRLDTSVRVRYTILTEKYGIYNEQTKNISIGGIRINMTENVKPTTSVELQIYLPGDIIPLVAKGEVVWQEQLLNKQEKNIYDTGIKFIQINIDDRNRINQYMLSILRDKMKHIR